jgi:hypothetical protein
LGREYVIFLGTRSAPMLGAKYVTTPIRVLIARSSNDCFSITHSEPYTCTESYKKFEQQFFFVLSHLSIHQETMFDQNLGS